MPPNIDTIDVNGLIKDLLGTLSGAMNDDIKHYVKFADRQAKALGKQAAWIAEGVVNGELDDEERDWFLTNLGELSANFARTVATLTILTIEKAWNAIAGEIWKVINGAVNTALGFSLPIPKLPDPN